MIDALQFVEEHGEVCPADRKPGIIGNQAGAGPGRKFFESGYREGVTRS